ncbi:MAG: hypothetical protein MI974_17325 [Chitinophagales bacterium]|nr:hypothetical protein [Chitinophagales bacterium]
MIKRKQYILAVNCPLFDGNYTFDGNACLFENGRLKLAIVEERISRKKYDGNFKESINYLLHNEGISSSDLDKVIIASFAKPIENNENYVQPIKDDLKKLLGVKENDIEFVNSHHETHALYAVAQSGFEECLVCVVDNLGSNLSMQSQDVYNLKINSFEQTSLYQFSNNELTLLNRMHDTPQAVGFGRLFSIVTRYIGFSSYHNAGKTMGMSSYCKLGDSYAIADKAKKMTYCFFADDGLKDLSEYFDNTIPPPIEISFNDKARLAKWVQNYYQESITKFIEKHVADTNIENICIVGGVALNSVANTHIQRALDLNVFIPSSPGDSGISIGAGVHYLLNKTNTMPIVTKSPYLGKRYSATEIEKALLPFEDILNWELYEHDLAKDAAEKLKKEEVIFWFQGRSEFGPRALGNRSILASPKNNWMKDIVNHLVKNREWFRPFAPSILIEKTADFFKTDQPSPYMMKIAEVKEVAYRTFPACIHVDGTSRYHTVSEAMNQKFHHLINTFYEMTNIPVVLNTSFNLAGMPIVEKPEDAIQCFLKSPYINYLYIDNFIVTKA